MQADPLPILSSNAWPSGVDGSWLFKSAALGVTRWKCGDGPTLKTGEKVQQYFVVAFVHAGSFAMRGPRGRILADVTTATFFNPGEPYCTSHPYGCGDHGSSLVLDASLVREIVGLHAPAVVEEGAALPAPGCFVAPRACLLQRLLVARAEARFDSVAVEETAMRLADELLRGSLPQAALPADGTGRTTRDLVEEIRGLLVDGFREPLRLEDIARRVGRSTFHVCRAFRSRTGISLHRYLTRLRLRAALEEARPGELTDTALDAGFSSHSHFSAAFRQEFGVTPSGARRLLASPSEVLRGEIRKAGSRRVAAPRRIG